MWKYLKKKIFSFLSFIEDIYNKVTELSVKSILQLRALFKWRSTAISSSLFIFCSLRRHTPLHVPKHQLYTGILFYVPRDERQET
jgi:hypothetical protein